MRAAHRVPHHWGYNQVGRVFLASQTTDLITFEGPEMASIFTLFCGNGAFDVG